MIVQSTAHRSVTNNEDAGPQVDASYGLNPTLQSPIGSERVGMKGEISHPTLNMFL